MQGDAPETMETLRAALLAMEHRATTAEATVAALMADGAATLAALRDAAVAEAARHATAAERARCLAAASRVGAFDACDEMLRAAPDAGETPPQAFGRGVAEGRRQEREACARICDKRAAWERGHDNLTGDTEGHAAEALRNAAADIRARAPQEPPQRPEAPRDGATPAPDAPSPAGGLPGAAAGVGDDTPGRAWERGRLAGLDEAAAVVRAEADAREGQRGALSQHDAVACDRTVGALRRVAYAVERAKTLVSATKGGAL